MPTILTTAGVGASIERIIRDARRQLVLVSPYLRLSRNVYERLRDADSRKVGIELVFGKKQLNADEDSKLAALTHLSSFFSENLHAKCYYNERWLVITSMNLYEFSEKNNRELGVLFTKEERGYDDAVREIRSIVASAVRHRHQAGRSPRVTPPKSLGSQVLSDIVEGFFGRRSSRTGNNRRAHNGVGHCIRCRDRIQYATRAPYCGSCYAVWAEFENPSYVEEFCHRCGHAAETTIDRPLCFTCFKN